MEESGTKLNLSVLIQKIVTADSSFPTKSAKQVFPYVQKYLTKRSDTHVYDRYQVHRHERTVCLGRRRRTTFLTEKRTSPYIPLELVSAAAIPQRKRLIIQNKTVGTMRKTFS